MENVFIQSQLVDPEEIRQTGAFTTLPIRIHKRNDIADATARRVLKDWGYHVGDGIEEKVITSFSKLGNLNAFTYTEVLPERLAILTYLFDLGLIHDDVSGSMEIGEALAEHRHFEESLNVANEIPKENDAESRGAKMKRLASQVLLDAIRIDRELGIYMMEIYQKERLAIVENLDDKEFESLEEYFTYRKCNFGLRAFWAMVEYGMGFRLTDEEKELVQQFMDPIEEGTMLTNDYWGWDREYRDWKENGNRLVNSVDIVCKIRGVSIDQARDIVKSRIISVEQDHLKRKAEFYEKHPDIPLHLKRWIEAGASVLSGTHYWASRCPRHHSHARSSSPELLKNEYSHEADGSTSMSSLSFTGDPLDGKSSRTSESSQSNCDHLCEDEKTIEKVEKKDDSEPTEVEDAKKQQVRKYMWNTPDSVVLESPCHYINSMPSKGVRSLLIKSLNLWLHVPNKSIETIDNIVRMLHNASLILDDIEDNSTLRRGKAATHTIFGHAQAINSANYMVTKAVQEGRKLPNAESVDVLLQDLVCLYAGQSWDIHWKHNLVCPSEEEYMNMVDNKTGGLFRMLLRLMQAESPIIPIFDFDCLIVLVGRFFQVRDDYMNLQSTEYSDQKGFCEDLDEGKFSYLILHCLQHKPEFGAQILGIFRQRPTVLGHSATPLPRETKMHIIDLLRRAGTFAHVKGYLIQLEADIEAEIGKLEDSTGELNPMLRLLLAKLSVKDHVEADGK